MRNEGPTVHPRIISIGNRGTSRGESWPWHTHPFDELCLIEGDSTVIGHGGKRTPAKSNTLYLFRRGEEHGFWNGAGQSPDLWVIHFAVPESLYAELPMLADPDPETRVWTLSDQQVHAFRDLFVKISVETSFPASDARVACASWLQLMLATLHRWRTHKEAPHLGAATTDPELLELWEVINESVGQQLADLDNLPDMVPNYDSLRHRFRKAFGLSPRAMMLRLRMQRAQTLLLDGRMSVKEVAFSVGYYRQHEFARAFRKAFGVAPSQWRRKPRI